MYTWFFKVNLKEGGRQMANNFIRESMCSGSGEYKERQDYNKRNVARMPVNVL
jgi:hypothetical protein